MAATPQSSFAPLPSTTRGYGFHLSGTEKGKDGATLVYGNASNVVIRNVADPSQSTLFFEHKAKVNVAKFSPNGEWVASGDDNGKVLIWARTSQVIKLEVSVGSRVLDISWSPDGKRIIAVGDGKKEFAKAFMWDSGNNIGEISGHGKAILSCDFKPTRPFRVATGAEDRHVKLHKGPPFQLEKSFTEHTRYPNCVRYSPDGTKLVSVGADSKIFIFEAKSGDKIAEWNGAAGADAHKGSIYSASWSPDSKKLLTAGADKTAKIWNAESGQVETTFTFAEKPTRNHMQVSCLWLGSGLFSVGLSGFISYLDPENPSQPKRVVMGHQVGIKSMTVDRANKLIYTSDSTGRVIQWNAATGDATDFTGTGHGDGKQVNHVALSSDGSHLATTGIDDTLRWNTADAPQFATDSFALGGFPKALASASQDAGLVAVATSKQKLFLVRDGKALSNITLPGAASPTSIAFSQDDTELAVGFEDGKVRRYSVDGDEAKEIAVIAKHTGEVMSIAYSPDGQQLITSDRERYIFVWNRDDYSKPINTGWRFHNGRVPSVAFSPDSSVAASCSVDLSIYVWTNPKQGKISKKALEFTHYVATDNIAWLDDNTLVSTGGDHCVRQWKVERA